MLISPCRRHPDTGEPCPLLRQPKDNGKCRSCAHRIRYIKAIDGHVDPVQGPTPGNPQPENEKSRAGQRCWWHLCHRAPVARGLCKSHYTMFSQGRFTVWLNHTPLDAREELYRTIMRMAVEHEIDVKEAVAILVDEGAVQYRKRA